MPSVWFKRVWFKFPNDLIPERCQAAPCGSKSRMPEFPVNAEAIQLANRPRSSDTGIFRPRVVQILKRPNSPKMQILRGS